MTNTANRWTHRFGPFEFDARSGELHREDQTARLSPHLAALLETLLEHPGEVVTRETLRQRVWPCDTFVDFEHGLTVAMARLRDALSDSAGHPQYVETIPRRGYRWLVAVESTATTAAPHATTATTAALLVTDRPAKAPAEGPVSAPVQAPLDPTAGGPAAPSSRVNPRSRWALILLSVAGLAGLLWVVLGPATQGRDVALRAGSPGSQVGDLSPSVREFYTKASQAELARSLVEWRSAVGYYNRVVEAAPQFAPARAGLAIALASGAYYAFVTPGEAAPAARLHAREAMRLDPGLAAAHVAMGDVRFLFDWDWNEAEADYGNASALDPTDEQFLRSYARWLSKSGRFEESLSLRKLLQQRDPIDLSRAISVAGAYLEARRFDDALLEMGRSEAVGMEARPRARAVTASAYAGKRDCDNAIREADRALATLDDALDQVTLGATGWVYATCGAKAPARAALARLESAAMSGDEITRAAVYGALGDTQQALTLVERAVANRSPTAVVLGVDPMLDSLRDEPRFQRALAIVRGGPPALPGASGTP